MSCIRGLRGIPRTPTLPQASSSRDAARMLRWRRRQLMAAGLDELSAHRLAVRTEVDIHAVLTLQDAGAATPLGPGQPTDEAREDRRHV